MLNTESVGFTDKYSSTSHVMLNWCSERHGLDVNWIGFSVSWYSPSPVP